MFLTEQFRLLQQWLEDAIPPAKRAFLQQFYSQVCLVTITYVSFNTIQYNIRLL